MQLGTTNYFYTRDHLGSVRELSDNPGAVVTRYDYDPYGRRTQVTGTIEADFGFTGHYHHKPTGLALAKYRAYSADFGRWISGDPLRGAERMQGPNLYRYVFSDPVNFIDPLGMDGGSPYLPDPSPKPQGWGPNWSQGVDNRGSYTESPDGVKWYPHAEDDRHWPHYDSSDNQRFPQKCEKPWPGQKQPPYGDQSPTNPWPKPPAKDDVPWWAPFITIPTEIFVPFFFGLPQFFLPPERPPSYA